MTTPRDQNLRKLASEDFDVLIVGAGINGAVSAAALAAKGAKVALVDRADFASFTSQESSNLVWGGIKYLENFEFGLVWKLCASRNELIRSYPANVREIRFFAPLERDARALNRAVPVLNAGGWLYWLMGRCFTAPPRWLTRGRIASDERIVNLDRFKGGVEYSDAYLLDNDARFVFGFVRTALNHGATVANYVEVERAVHDEQRGWLASVVDRDTGQRHEVRARCLINAAGPFVDALNQANAVETRARHVFSKGIHLIVKRLATGSRVLAFFDDNNRLFFVIPMGPRSVIGTTDTRVDDPTSQVTDEDREFLLDNINKRLALERPLTRDDVIAERCGVRPLVVEGGGDGESDAWFSLSRKHIVEVDEGKRHLSIFGGKLTDCLNVGEEVSGFVGGFGVELREPEQRWYGEPPEAVRQEFMAEARRIHLDERPDDPLYEELSQRLWRRYGTNAFGMLEDIGRDPTMADPVIEGTEYRRCELAFAARSELVVKLEDFLRRRSKVAQVLRHDELREARGLMEACEILFGDRARERFHEYFSD